MAQDVKSQLQKDMSVDALAKAYPVSVQFCKYACVHYQPQMSDAPPHIGYTPGFRKGDYIHIKEEYNEDWWIGRIIGYESQMVFVPREHKLLAISKETSKDNDDVYIDAPIMRPIVLLGPSIKTSKLSQLIQIPLVTFMKEKFINRLVTVFSNDSLSCDEGINSTEGLAVQVYQAGRSMNLVYLDCGTNMACDFDRVSKLHPLFIYIKISRQEVLQKLIRQMTTTSKEKGELLDTAYQLSENSCQYSLVINDSNLDDACQRLELFLEGYWASTRSILLQ